MSEEFYNRLTLGDEGNRTVFNNSVDSRSHRHGCQYSAQVNPSEVTGANSRPYRIDNRVERTEVNLHLKHRTQRRSTTSESASSRAGRHRTNERHLEDESRTYRANRSGKYEGEERQTPVFSNECDSGTVLDRGYMPEIPRATPASNEQAVVVGSENTKALLERMNSYAGSEWNGANLAPSLTSYSCEGAEYANYTQPSSKQVCPHVKGQQQESLREDNNNVSCVSFSDRDDKRYNSSSVKHHLAARYSDRYKYLPGELERQYRPDGPSSYYYGVQTENMIRWKKNNNNIREKNGRQIPGACSKHEKHGLSKTLPRRYPSTSDRNVTSSDSESGPSSSEREYWPNSYCLEKRKKRLRKKGNYRPKHYLGESDPSEHSDPGHGRYNEKYSNHVCCSSAECEYEQQRSRSSSYGLNNRRNISRSLTSVSSIDDENGSFRAGFTFNRISPRMKGKSRISKVNIKSFSAVQLNPSRINRATSSTSDIGTHDGAHSRLCTLEKNALKARKTSKDSPSLSDSSCASPSLKKSPFNTHLRGRKSSTSGGETPSTTPVPRICSPEIVDDQFQAPASSSFKAIHAPGSQGTSVFITGDEELNTSTSTEEGAKALKNLIENLEEDADLEEDQIEIKRPELLPLNVTNVESNDVGDVSTPESMVAPPMASSGIFSISSKEDDLQSPLTPGGVNRVSSFPFGKDTPYSIQKPFVTLVNIVEEDEAVHSDSSSGQVRRRRESVTRRKLSKENQADVRKETERDVVTPNRRPSYVQAQNLNRISPKQEDEKIVEGSRTKPNGKEQHVYCDNIDEKHSIDILVMRSEKESVKRKEETKLSDDNGNSRRRLKKSERPRIPTILNLDKALDELFDDVKSEQTSSANLEPRKSVSGQESVPERTTNISVTDTVNRDTRKRSNSIEDPSSAVKLIASEADSTYMQRADGKVELRREKNEQSEIDRSLELLDELVVELSEKEPGNHANERPALSRNVDGKSAGSASDAVMSPSPSQTSINSEKSTSGNELIDKDVGVSSLSDMYPSRYHSDPTPRVIEDYTTIQETIAEYDIKPRNSNSEPAINGKLLEQAADLAKAKAAEKENAEHKNSIEHATSTPADLANNAQPQQKLRRRESEKARRRQAAKAAAQIEANAKEAKHGEDDGTKGGEQPDHRTWPRTKSEPEAGEVPTGKKKKATKSEMRWHVIQNLIETEQSYVQSLQYLVKEYLNPLRKSEGIVEPALVNEMFYQIPEILKNHEVFLKHLAVRVQDWSDNSKLGDIFVSSFTKCLLVDAYSQFISNFLRARTAVRTAAMAKPGFLKYCEQRSRDHKEKLTLQDLMIMPVQRIPRYVLIITDLLKYTPAEHPDHENLLSALGEIKTLAERMNKGEQEIDQAEKEAERLRDLEASIEGIAGLVLPRRKYKRQDLVAEMKGGLSKKDRCLFLFSDLLVCATVKRKQTSLRRGSLSLFSGQSAAEMNKYRLLWQSPLDDVELVTTDGDLKSPLRNSEQSYREKLELDLNTVSTISKLTESVSIPHQALDDAIRDLASDLNHRLVEQHTQRSSNATLMSLENTVVLNIGSREPFENYMFVFLSKEIKSSWEAYFLDAKQQLAYTKDSSPNFQSAIPINKSRSGLQFTCASPTVAPKLTKRGTHCGSGDVWVASSDGCVGQVSMLSPLREFEQGTTYSPCQARILSIAPVPGWKLAGINTTNVEYDFKDPVESNNSTLRSKSSGYHTDDTMPNNRRSVASTTKAGREEIIAFDSSTDDDDMGDDSYAASPSPPSFDGRLSPEGSSLGTAGSLDGDLSSDTRDDSDYHENQSTDDESKSRQRPDKKEIEGQQDEQNEQPTVWMGAEDGYIYIFPVTSAIKQRRNKTKIQKGSPVQCILYVDNQVFVGLANGDLCVYKRSPNLTWEINAPRNITISSNARISCMTAVLGRLWVGCNNQVVVVNTTTLEIETRFNASMDSSRSLHAMASSGMGVWISIQSLSVIRLYHATTCEHLADVDTKDAVHKMLAGSDAIIKQHKAACLRVTALLTCKDLLWIGTSAGVVLTLPLPIIAPNATSVQAPLDVTASAQGHTGHVRFLTAVEIGKSEEKDETSSSQPANRSPRRTQLSIEKTSLPFPSEGILIVSGGDGYEDFKSTTNESAGREDSTNHLLIWKV